MAEETQKIIDALDFLAPQDALRKNVIFVLSSKNYNLSIENCFLRINIPESSFFVIQIYLPLIMAGSSKYKRSKM